jgi:heterodisulfide reductase subunit B
MAYAIFHCCVTAHHLPEEETLTMALLARLNVKTETIPAFGCCGYPLQNVDVIAALTAAARNMALAERAGKSILTTCACCYDMLRHSARRLKDPALKEKVNVNLAAEGLVYNGTARVQHLLTVLIEAVGVDRITGEVGSSVEPRKVVIHSGCKLARSVNTTEPDTRSPSTYLALLTIATGATVIDWGLDNDCCGSGIRNTDQELAQAIGQAKMVAAQQIGADSVVVACPFCRLQLRRALADTDGIEVMTVVRWLCLALGIRTETSKRRVAGVNHVLSSVAALDEVSSPPCRAGQSGLTQ